MPDGHNDSHFGSGNEGDPNYNPVYGGDEDDDVIVDPEPGIDPYWDHDGDGIVDHEYYDEDGNLVRDYGGPSTGMSSHIAFEDRENAFHMDEILSLAEHQRLRRIGLMLMAIAGSYFYL